MLRAGRDGKWWPLGSRRRIVHDCRQYAASCCRHRPTQTVGRSGEDTMIRSLLGCIAFVAGTSFAASVQLPANSLTIPALSTTGASFTYSGTLTQADTITFTQTGNPCLQASGTGY